MTTQMKEFVHAIILSLLCFSVFFISKCFALYHSIVFFKKLLILNFNFFSGDRTYLDLCRNVSETLI